MARLKGCKKVTWGITGRLRDIVFRETKQGIVAAEYNKKPYNVEKANTANAKKFGAVSRLGLDLKPLSDVGFAGLMGNSYNSNSQFIKKNYGAVAALTDGTVNVEYANVVVAVGAGKKFLTPDVSMDANGKVLVEWSATNLTEDDAKTVCYFGVLCPTSDRNIEPVAMFSLGKDKMTVGSATIEVSARWTGEKAYVYGFTMTEKGIVSSSQFLGEVTID